MPTAILRLTAIICLLTCLATPAAAQSDVQLTQWYEMPTLHNPAAVGRTDYINIRGAGRLQWLGVDNAPRSFALAADMPLKLFGKRLGVGLVAVNESYGLYKNLQIAAQLAYKFKRLGGEFTIALQPGIYDQGFSGSDVFIPDNDDYHQSNDDAIPTQDIHGTAFDLGAGVWYKHRLFSAGLSCTHLTSPSIKLRADGAEGGTATDAAGGVERYYEFEAKRTLYFAAQGNIPVNNTLFEIAPSLLVKSDFTFTTAEIMARARYNRFLSFGVGYRWDDAIIATVAAEIKNFYIGYSYDYPTGAIHAATSGSHEIMAGYRLKLDLGEKNRNRHKSIRIM